MGGSSDGGELLAGASGAALVEVWGSSGGDDAGEAGRGGSKMV